MTAIRHRFESFGGILAFEDPPILLHVDREFMRGLGHGPAAAWEGPETALLSAPLEVHLSVTNACGQACPHCYMDSGPREEGELSDAEAREAIELLAAMGVFHVALGGGEALERPGFFELAEQVRARGMVPNLTTNGSRITRETARRCRIFGQVNVSIDEIGGPAHAERVRAVDLLREAGVRVGVNCVVTRSGFDRLDGVLAFAQERGLADVELLRLKPSGRGRRGYLEARLTPAQNRELYATIERLSLAYRVPVKIDCSFVPMFCWGRPDRNLMDRLSVYGCEAGNVLLGVRSDGTVAGCSFLPGDGTVFDLPQAWRTSGSLARLRSWTDRAPEPCRSCDYLAVCKGGCRAVSAHVAGDPLAPDPECPFAEATGRRP